MLISSRATGVDSSRAFHPVSLCRPAFALVPILSFNYLSGPPPSPAAHSFLRLSGRRGNVLRNIAEPTCSLHHNQDLCLCGFLLFLSRCCLATFMMQSNLHSQFGCCPGICPYETRRWYLNMSKLKHVQTEEDSGCRILTPGEGGRTRIKAQCTNGPAFAVLCDVEPCAPAEDTGKLRVRLDLRRKLLTGSIACTAVPSLTRHPPEVSSLTVLHGRPKRIRVRTGHSVGRHGGGGLAR